jgi:hypothetical protein
VGRISYRVALGVLTAALAAAIADWLWIYQPLAVILRQQLTQHTAPPAAFRNLHVSSMICNQIVLGLSLVAALLAHWPNRRNGPAVTDA